MELPCPQSHLTHSFTFSRSLFKYHLLGEVFPDGPIQNWPALTIGKHYHCYATLIFTLFYLLFVSPDQDVNSMKAGIFYCYSLLNHYHPENLTKNKRSITFSV